MDKDKDKDDPFRFVSYLFEMAVWLFQVASQTTAEELPLYDQRFTLIFRLQPMLILPLLILIGFLCGYYACYKRLRTAGFHHLGIVNWYYRTHWQATLFAPAAYIESLWYWLPVRTNVYDPAQLRLRFPAAIERAMMSDGIKQQTSDGLPVGCE